MTQQRRGVFADRNVVFIRTAAELGDDAIWFGARAPWPRFDAYGDSNRVFARKLGKELGVQVVTPCILWPKWYVRLYVNHATLAPLGDHIWSSEGYDYNEVTP